MSTDQHTSDISEKLKKGRKLKPAEYIISALALCLLGVLIYLLFSSGSRLDKENDNLPETPLAETVKPPKDFVLPPSIKDEITLLDIGGDSHVVSGGDDFLLNRNDYINRGWISSDTITLVGPNGQCLLADRNQFLANRQYYIKNDFLDSRYKILVGNDGRYVLIDNNYYDLHANKYKNLGYKIQTDEIATSKTEVLADAEYIKLLERYINNGSKGPKPTRYR
jgi:hypothetical protein